MKSRREFVGGVGAATGAIAMIPDQVRATKSSSSQSLISQVELTHSPVPNLPASTNCGNFNFSINKKENRLLLREFIPKQQKEAALAEGPVVVKDGFKIVNKDTNIYSSNKELAVEPGLSVTLVHNYTPPRIHISQQENRIVAKISGNKISLAPGETKSISLPNRTFVGKETHSERTKTVEDPKSDEKYTILKAKSKQKYKSEAEVTVSNFGWFEIVEQGK